MDILNNHLPQTIIELENWMRENCFNFNSYSVNGNHVNEGFGIDKWGELFVWYYTERVKRENLEYFKSESEIAAYAFNQIKSDQWAGNHCVGFSSDLNKISELKDELNKIDIDFFEDKIPYYGIDRPVYRVFVWGCDIRKTEHLKEKYWTEKN